MKYFFLFLLISFSLFSQDLAPLIDAQNTFSFQLQSNLPQSKNYFFSGSNLHEILSMILLGGRGKTAFEMERALEVGPLGKNLHNLYSSLNSPKPKDKLEGYTLTKANAGFIQKNFPLKTEYIQDLKNNYQIEMHSADFVKDPNKERKKINEWVFENTEKRIKNLLNPGSIDKTTQWVFANTLYFKSNWQFPFDKKLTKKGTFNSLDKKRTVSYMEQIKEFSFYEDENWKAVSLPYSRNKLAAVFLLPKNNMDLDNNRYKEIKGKMAFKKIRLRIPKFKFEYKVRLAPLLINLGIKTAFSPEADFSGISDKKGLQLSDVIHQTFLSIDEYGTEAAAASAAMMFGATLDSESPVDVLFNQPFYFFIEELENNSILFSGRVVKP